jgi:tRNA 2-thiouridine synthesizing protein A
MRSRTSLPCEWLELILKKRTEADKIIDLRGVSCPWSILKAKSQLGIMEPGEVLEVLASDPLMFEDFPRVLGQSGHYVVEINLQPGNSRLYVKRGQKEESSDIVCCTTYDSETKRR